VTPEVTRLHPTIANAEAKFETCLEAQNCLKVFEDGSPTSMLLRGDNTLQLKCLNGEDMPAKSLQALCNKWVYCFEHGTSKQSMAKQFLITYLNAAGAAGQSKRVIE